MLLSFPNFNIYSSSLLILTVQGFFFSLLLLSRYFKHKNYSDLLLSSILLITCYHQTTYTLGFLGWYDTYNTTKINYYLVDLSLVLAPLLFFYLKSTVSPSFQMEKSHLWQFLPWLCFLTIKLTILLIDASQPGFTTVQNGTVVVEFQWKYLDPLVFLLKGMQMLLYLAFSFQLLFSFRDKIKHYFANTYQIELTWLRNFLIVYGFLYLFNSIQTVINETIVDLSWKQEWWYYLLSGITIIYAGTKGYFTDLSALREARFDSFHPKIKPKDVPKKASLTQEFIAKKEDIEKYFIQEKPYLNPELSLIILSQDLGLSREELSEIINQGFKSRFNDFINSYRVEETKRLMKDGKHQQLSLLGLAYEAGFNSKATFNRAFKKVENLSPSEFLESIS